MDPVFLHDNGDVPRFEFPPLDSGQDCLRLLSFGRHNCDEDFVTCQLSTTAFSTRPRYEVVSYLWGDDEPTQTIMANGQTLKVPRALFAALQFAMRRSRTGGSKYFWIDVLCVDQLNPIERRDHVRRLSQIVFRATSLLIWLGEEHSRYNDVLSILDEQHGQDDRAIQDQSKADILAAESLTRDARIILGSDSIWLRVWNVKEFRSARKILICAGNTVIKWSVFLEWVREEKARPVTKETRALVKLAMLHRIRHSKWEEPLENLLRDHQHVICKDPRDKLYGVSDFACLNCEEFGSHIYPDYKKSLLEVWTDAVDFVNIKDSEDCDIPNSFSADIELFRLVKNALGLKDSGARYGDILEFQSCINTYYEEQYAAPVYDLLLVGKVKTPDTHTSVTRMVNKVSVADEYMGISEQRTTVISDILEAEDQRFSITRKVKSAHSAADAAVGGQSHKCPDCKTVHEMPEPEGKDTSPILVDVKRTLRQGKKVTYLAIVPPDTRNGDLVFKLTEDSDGLTGKYIVVRRMKKPDPHSPQHTLIGTAFLGHNTNITHESVGNRLVGSPYLNPGRETEDNAMIFNPEALYWLIF